MLDANAISQLSQLKQDIVDSKEYATGVVVGTTGRFGFVKLEDGRDAFLAPEKMQRVLPGDTVKVSVTKNKKDKLEADLESVVETSLDRFIGEYRTKGSAHFVAPQDGTVSRWIFLPAQQRAKCKEGDLIVAKLLRHPFKDGKPSAKVLERIGQTTDSKIDFKLVKAKYNLNRADNETLVKQAKSIEKTFNAQEFGERVDLTHIPFVTIDSVKTRDMDDAISVETLEDGKTRLHVAIADPSVFIDQGSTLANSAQVRAQTVYLLGGYIPMLPLQLSNGCFSLEAGKQRPAIVCHIDINSNGSIETYDFEIASIQSRHKLAYDNVAAYLDGKSEGVNEYIAAPTDDDAQAMNEQAIAADMLEQLQSLKTLATLRKSFRDQEFLTINDQTDYEYQLDELGNIDSIIAKPRNSAHMVVEEAMLATNICAGKLLAEHKLGLCVSHLGFRTERLGEVKALLKEEEINCELDINSLEGHIALFKQLESNEAKKHLVAPLRRMMQSGELSLTPQPHLGMGVEHYATITSPIRRFADLYNHWAIRHILQESSFEPLKDTALEGVLEQLDIGRQADRELNRTLILRYTEKLVGQTAKGKVRIVTQQGFGVRLDDTGIDGFVLFPKGKEKTFDAKRMTIAVDDVTYHLNKEVEVKIDNVDKVKRRIAFSIV